MTYVPLVGKSAVQGVLEVFGLSLAENASSNNFLRSDKLLRAMINAKDYKCVILLSHQ